MTRRKSLCLGFADMTGHLYHRNLPLRRSESVRRALERVRAIGLSVNGANFQGYRSIERSDLIVVPDPRALYVPRTRETPEGWVLCDVCDPHRRAPLPQSPRRILQNAVRSVIRRTRVSRVRMGAECEFYLLPGRSVRSIAAIERGSHIRVAERLRNVIAEALVDMGVAVSCHHVETNSPLQQEIVLESTDPVSLADRILLVRETAHRLAEKAGWVATFMPRPFPDRNGNGLHVHISLWRGNGNVFYDRQRKGGLSRAADRFVEGILRHTPALMAFCASTTNSYGRLMSSAHVPQRALWGFQNRTAAVRIPSACCGDKQTRIEYRLPDAAGNPYLVLAAILMAGGDGVSRARSSRTDKDEFAPPSAERAGVLPRTLDGALDRLSSDRMFLQAENVFPSEMVSHWIGIKSREAEAVRARVHPFEKELYFDA
ncbi:MAG TPA: glutamine synthetase family protein [Elusimicrobiota bacterium]|nr:glutamine synthetase family protein [Elusimicrobiota bacterium]